MTDIIDQPSDPLDRSVTHSYFTPMVDMLAGIVFILVILLASTMLVSREEFVEGAQAQVEIERIRAELAALQEVERVILQPRRDAESARRLLIQRLALTLAQKGYATSAELDAGRLVVGAHVFFVDSAPSMSLDGLSFATALSEALNQELPCLAGQEASAAQASCALYPPARLDVVSLGVRSGSANPVLSKARALSLLSSVISASPGLVSMRAVDGTGLMSYGELAAIPVAAAGEGVPSALDRGEVVVDIQMNVPAAP